jgi:hypothetical protein
MNIEYGSRRVTEAYQDPVRCVLLNAEVDVIEAVG